MHKLWAVMWVTAGVGLLVIGYYAATTFYGRYYDVMASWGVHSEDVYEARLRRAIQFDPTYGYAHLKLARYYLLHGTSSMAMNHQLKAMDSFNSVRAFGQLGSIHLRLGHEKEARETYERAVRMNPNYVEALEQLAVIALKTGDSERLQDLTGEILRRDLKNLNVYYLRAKDAEWRGDTNAALLNYQIISAELNQRRAIPERAMFTEKEVRARLNALKRQGDVES